MIKIIVFKRLKGARAFITNRRFKSISHGNTKVFSLDTLASLSVIYCIYGKCRDHHISVSSSETQKDPDYYKMDKAELQTIIYSKLDELPTLPAVLPRLLTLMQDPNTSTDPIAEAISSDPALTAKILKVANSAYYGFSQQISSLERAIPLLGFNMVRSLALSIGVFNSLPSGTKSAYFSWEDLWIHGLAVAETMQKLGKQIRTSTDTDHYFIIGLLHDIGKTVLDLFFQQMFQQAQEEANTGESLLLYETERKIIGFDHGEVGGILLIRWQFPEKITFPISVHHQEIPAENASAKDIAMLRIADTLPQICGLGKSGNAFPPEIQDQDLKILGIEQQDLEAAKDHLNETGDRIKELFSAMK